MNVVTAPRQMTVPEFLDWMPDGEKWELVGGIPGRMMPESDLHEWVKTNVIGALTRRLRPPSPCRAAVDGRQIMIDDATSYRPDAYVNCAPSTDPKETVAEKPTVIFEVAATSLSRDTMEKRANYFRHPSVAHVIVVDAENWQVIHYRRGEAATDTLSGDDALRIDGEAMLDIPVAEFFERLPPLSVE